MQDSANAGTLAAAGSLVSTSDWVLIGSTLTLAIAAFLTPVVGEWIKAKWYAPRLRVDATLSKPACHRTRLDLRLSPAQVEKHAAYYFRLEVRNVGRTQARRCEVVIEGIDELQSTGRFEAFPRYSPVGLVWGSSYEDFVDINPGRHFFCDFVSIPDVEAQATFHSMVGYVDPLDAPVEGAGLVLASRAAFYSQPNRLRPGEYRVRLALFSETADTLRLVVPISWSGTWHDDEDAMFRELTFGPAKSAA